MGYWGYVYRGYIHMLPPIMTESRIDNTIENCMDTGTIYGLKGTDASQIIQGHGLLLGYIFGTIW